MHERLKLLSKLQRKSIFKLSSCFIARSNSRSFKMAANGESEEKKDETDVQIVNIETVVAVDNKGIDYDKLIS